MHGLEIDPEDKGCKEGVEKTQMRVQEVGEGRRREA